MSERAWAEWSASRPATDLLHLDSAAVGRSSAATLEAVAAHARREAELGGYVAEAHAGDELEGVRRDVAQLLGTEPSGVALVESAMAALEALVGAWPWETGARVGVAASEWGPNLEVLAAHGLEIVPLRVDGVGVLDLGELESLLVADPPDVLLLDTVAAHRGLVQPTTEVIELGRVHGLPVWLDAAQAVGQLPVPPGADAVVATSRKWLGGPRGIGMLAVAERHHAHLRVRRPAKHPDWSVMQILQPEEAHVAGRLGLGVAIREYLDLGPDAVAQRLVEVGGWVREMAADLDGWEVVQPEAPAGATTALRPTAGQDAARAREHLLHEHRILTTVGQPWRAPLELDGSAETWLRLSPHVDLGADDLERVARALAGCRHS